MAACESLPSDDAPQKCPTLKGVHLLTYPSLRRSKHHVPALTAVGRRARMSERHWLARATAELPPSALRAERQQLSHTVAPETPLLGDGGELVHHAVALRAADQVFLVFHVQ